MLYLLIVVQPTVQSSVPAADVRLTTTVDSGYLAHALITVSGEEVCT